MKFNVNNIKEYVASIFIVSMNLQFNNLHDSQMTLVSRVGAIVITNTSVRIKTRLATFCCINFFFLSPMEELCCVSSCTSFDFEIFTYRYAVTKIGMQKRTKNIIVTFNVQKRRRIAIGSARTKFPTMILSSERILFQVRGFLTQNDRSMAIRHTASKPVRMARH